MGVLGGVFVLKSGLRILIRAPEVPFSVPQNSQTHPKWPILGVLGGTKNGTSGARIKILRPLFNTNTPQNPHLDTLGTILDPRKVIFSHFVLFGEFWSFARAGGYLFGKGRSWCQVIIENGHCIVCNLYATSHQQIGISETERKRRKESNYFTTQITFIAWLLEVFHKTNHTNHYFDFLP